MVISRLSHNQTAEHHSATAQDRFDDRFGVHTDMDWRDTAGLADISGHNWKYGIKYQGLHEETFDQILGLLLIPYDRFIFLDLGSGKGKALLLASRFPFRQIIGVEYSYYLHGIALRNIAMYQNPAALCHAITSTCTDAAVYDIPSEPLVVYLFNPFNDVVLGAVAHNLTASLQHCRREVYLLYANAVHHELLLRFGFREQARLVIQNMTCIAYYHVDGDHSQKKQ